MTKTIDLEEEIGRLREIIDSLSCKSKGKLKRQFDEQGGVIYKEDTCGHCDVCKAKALSGKGEG